MRTFWLWRWELLFQFFFLWNMLRIVHRFQLYSHKIELVLSFVGNFQIFPFFHPKRLWLLAHVMKEGSPVVWQTARTASRLSHGEENEADVAERLTVSEDTMGWFYTISDLWTSVLHQLECGFVLRSGLEAPRKAADEQHEKSEILNQEPRWTGSWSLCLLTWVFASLPVSIAFSPSFIGNINGT